jgi:hypothetical protein
MKSGILTAALLAAICGAAPGAWAQAKLPAVGKVVATKPTAPVAILGNSADPSGRGGQRGNHVDPGRGDDGFGHFGGNHGAGGGSSPAR